MFEVIWNALFLNDSSDNVQSVTGAVVSISWPLLLVLISLIAIGIVAWKSTYVPDLPPVPRPPYVIQISSSPTLLSANRDRNSISDVRLLGSSTDVNAVLGRYPHEAINRLFLISNNNAAQRSTSSASSSEAQQTSRTAHSTNPNISSAGTQGNRQQSSNSVLLGIGVSNSRAATRPVISFPSSNAATPNLVVYHRVNVYHHHHHHHHHSNPNPDTRNDASANNTTTTTTTTTTSNSTATSTSSSTPIGNCSSSSSSSSSSVQSPRLTPQQSTGSNNSETSDNDIQIEVPPINITVSAPIGSAQNFQRENMSSLAEADTRADSVVVSGLRRRIPMSSPLTGTDENQVTSPGAELNINSHHDNSQAHLTAECAENNVPAQSESLPSPSNDIRFTIKFLNDTQMEVTTQATERILDFKRRIFASELSENKTVRLIFNGRVLDNDASTIRESGIFDQCVVHCLIGSRPASSNPSNPSHRSQRSTAGYVRGTPEPGMFFVSFVGVFLIFLWFICFHFGQHLFTQSAVVSLTVLTAIFLIGLVAFYLPVHPTTANPPAGTT